MVVIITGSELQEPRTSLRFGGCIALHTPAEMRYLESIWIYSSVPFKGTAVHGVFVCWGQTEQCGCVLYHSKRDVIERSDECGKPPDEQVTGNKISYLSLYNPQHDMIHTRLCAPHTPTHTHTCLYFLVTTTPRSSFFFLPLFPASVAHHAGVPAVMVCAVGAAGMTITIHGSLGESCTHWTRMRGAEGEDESQLEVRTLKNTNRVNERGRQRWRGSAL